MIVKIIIIIHTFLIKRVTKIYLHYYKIKEQRVLHWAATITRTSDCTLLASQSQVSIYFHLFPRKMSLSHLFLLSQLTTLFFYMYSVYRYLCCCYETLFISIFLTPVPYSSSCTTSVHIFSPECQHHLTLNRRTCRLTMYFSLFLFCHAVFGCLVFRFSLCHLLEISRSTISVWRGWLRHWATSRMVAGSISWWCHSNFSLT